MSEMSEIQKLKAAAAARGAKAKLAGQVMKHAEALDLEARERGFDCYRAFRAAHARGLESVAPEPESLLVDSPAETVQANAHQAYVVRRSNDTPLRFRGVLLGEVDESTSQDNEEFYYVSIYRTAGGSYICATTSGANYMPRPERRAAAFTHPSELVAWLRAEDGQLSVANVRALAKAAEADPAIAEAFGEDIA